MQRVTISLDDTLAAAFDLLVAQRSYASRSEAMRDHVRERVDAVRQTAARDGSCVASLNCVYDHCMRALADRLLDVRHDHHKLIVASTHIALDHRASGRDRPAARPDR